MNSEIIIEKMENSSPQLIEMFNKLLFQLNPNLSSKSENFIQEMLSQPHVHVFVAKDSKKTILGTIALVISQVLSGKRGKIEDVVVHSTHRGKGIGKALVKKALEKARDEKVEFVELTSQKSRIGADQFYQSLGFKVRETTVYRFTL